MYLPHFPPPPFFKGFIYLKETERAGAGERGWPEGEADSQMITELEAGLKLKALESWPEQRAAT